jgi:hypothetical protein
MPRQVIEDLIVLRVDKRVTHQQRSGDGPFHDPNYGHCTDAGVERQMFRCR